MNKVLKDKLSVQLGTAVRRNDIQQIKDCLFNGADVNYTVRDDDDDGSIISLVPIITCLDFWDDTHEVFKLLIQAGVDLIIFEEIFDFNDSFISWRPLNTDPKGIQLIKDAYFEQTGKRL